MNMVTAISSIVYSPLLPYFLCLPVPKPGLLLRTIYKSMYTPPPSFVWVKKKKRATVHVMYIKTNEDPFLPLVSPIIKDNCISGN